MEKEFVENGGMIKAKLAEGGKDLNPQDLLLLAK